MNRTKPHINPSLHHGDLPLKRSDDLSGEKTKFRTLFVRFLNSVAFATRSINTNKSMINFVKVVLFRFHFCLNGISICWEDHSFHDTLGQVKSSKNLERPSVASSELNCLLCFRHGAQKNRVSCPCGPFVLVTFGAVLLGNLKMRLVDVDQI